MQRPSQKAVVQPSGRRVLLHEEPPIAVGKNQDVTAAELAKVRRLTDFNLKMLISEIHDHGWPVARKTLEMMMPVKLER